jgi:hypothetical protein
VKIPPISFEEGMGGDDPFLHLLGFGGREKEGLPGIPLGDAVAEGEFGKKFFLFGVFLPHEL